MRRARNRGNTFVEFTFMGIPLLFILISTFEVARGMWFFHTLAHAAKDATRFAIVKGAGCSSGSNNCFVTVNRIAEEVRTSGSGLVPEELEIRMSVFDPINNTPMGTPQICPTALTCQNPTERFPPPGINSTFDHIRIEVRAPFRSAIALLWPGSRGVQFGVFNLGASATEKIQF